MTPDEITIVRALAGCSFAPGSSQKRFVRQMSARAAEKPLTDRQRAYLWAIAWSWRRQLSRGQVELAEKYSGGVGTRGRQVNEEAYRLRIKAITEHEHGPDEIPTKPIEIVQSLLF